LAPSKFIFWIRPCLTYTDRVVGRGRLSELDRYGNEIAAGVADDEQHERRGHVALVGVAVDSRNVGE